MAFTRILILLFFVVVTSHDKASALSIVSSESITVGSPVTIRCSADAIDMMSSGEKYYSVRLSRRTYSLTNENSLNAKEELFLLDAAMFYEGTNAYSFKYPKGIDWDIRFPTEEELLVQKYQRGVLYGELTIPKTICQDSGHYFCEVVYREIGLQTVEGVQELNGSVSASAMSANTVPHNVDGKFENKRSVEMRCNAEGPEDYKFFWEISCPSSFQFQVQQFVDYSPQNDIQDHEKLLIPSDPCGVYRHYQEMKFLMSSDRDGCTIRCEFGQFRWRSENIMQNHTFYLKEGNGLEFTVTPARPREQVDKSVEFSCTLGKDTDTYRDIIMMGINKGDETSAILLAGRNHVNIGSSKGLEPRFQAKGFLSKSGDGLSMSYLNLTLVGPVVGDSGDYVCDVYYKQQDGTLNTDSKTVFLKVQEASDTIESLQKTMRSLEQRLETMEKQLRDVQASCCSRSKRRR